MQANLAGQSGRELYHFHPSGAHAYENDENEVNVRYTHMNSGYAHKAVQQVVRRGGAGGGGKHVKFTNAMNTETKAEPPSGALYHSNHFDSNTPRKGDRGGRRVNYLALSLLRSPNKNKNRVE